MKTETDHEEPATQDEPRAREQEHDDRSNEKRGQEEAPKEKREDGKEGEQSEPKAEKKSRTPFIILGIVLVVAAIIGLLYYLHARNFESTDDAFIDGHVVQVSARLGGQVVAVHFTDNAVVKQGDLLIELDARPFQVALEKARAGLAQAKAQTTQQNAQTEVAAQNFNRVDALYNKDMRAVSREQVDSNKATLDAARGASEAGEANVAAAQSAVHDAELQLSYTKLFAIGTGRIARKQVEAGNYVQPGQTLCSLVLENPWVTANFKETQLTKMRIGMPVKVKVDAFPNRDLDAHVDSFQPGTGARFSLLPPENATGNYVKVVQRVPVKIVFDEPAENLARLAPGQSVVPKVDIREHPKREKAQ